MNSFFRQSTSPSVRIERRLMSREREQSFISQFEKELSPVHFIKIELDSVECFVTISLSNWSIRQGATLSFRYRCTCSCIRAISFLFREAYSWSRPKWWSTEEETSCTNKSRIEPTRLIFQTKKAWFLNKLANAHTISGNEEPDESTSGKAIVDPTNSEGSKRKIKRFELRERLTQGSKKKKRSASSHLISRACYQGGEVLVGGSKWVYIIGFHFGKRQSTHILLSPGKMEVVELGPTCFFLGRQLIGLFPG